MVNVRIQKNIFLESQEFQNHTMCQYQPEFKIDFNKLKTESLTLSVNTVVLFKLAFRFPYLTSANKVKVRKMF